MPKLSPIAFSLATTFGVIFAVPSFAGGIDYFFNSTPGNNVKKPLLSPFPGFSASSIENKPKAPLPVATHVPIRTHSLTLKPVPDNAPPKQQALIWFENFDDIIYTMGLSDHEIYVLKRPISQEVERLHEWISACNSMAKKYHVIAKNIRAMRSPHAVADLREFQTEAADWYDDTANLAEELTMPRAPAKTYEEVERAYQALMMRSKNLASVSNAATTLSTRLREQYSVHQPKYTDESAKYIDSVAHQVKEE
jgi:hypothetical protein